MTTKQMRWLATLYMVFGLPSLLVADEVVWRAIGSPPQAPAPTQSVPVVTLGRPIAVRPAAAIAPVVYNAPPASGGSGIVFRGQIADPTIPYPPPPPSDNLSLGPPAPGPTPAPPSSLPAAPLPVPSSAVVHTAGGPPDSVPPPNNSPFPPGDYSTTPAPGAPVGTTWWEKVTGIFNGGDKSDCSHRAKFQSDHAFDTLISPVTNPFFFEDPRSLTELRPIFMYQSAPSGNPVFRGGNSEFFGLQGRVAITERFSIVMNELGLVSLNPNDPVTGAEASTGFAEFKIGPKYTFYRNTQSGTVAAGGLTFEIPAGSTNIGQGTGTLGLDPYLTIGQHVRLPSGLGSLNFLGAGGFNFGVDDKRSEFAHASFHMDYNVANTNFYPLIECNWFHYTSGGTRTNLGFEGADLANFGSSNVGNKDLVTLALGLRYKFSEMYQIGGAVEWPVTAHQNTMTDFRATIDFIIRY